MQSYQSFSTTTLDVSSVGGCSAGQKYGVRTWGGCLGRRDPADCACTCAASDLPCLPTPCTSARRHALVVLHHGVWLDDQQEWECPAWAVLWMQCCGIHGAIIVMWFQQASPTLPFLRRWCCSQPRWTPSSWHLWRAQASSAWCLFGLGLCCCQSVGLMGGPASDRRGLGSGRWGLGCTCSSQMVSLGLTQAKFSCAHRSPYDDFWAISGGA